MGVEDDAYSTEDLFDPLRDEAVGDEEPDAPRSEGRRQRILSDFVRRAYESVQSTGTLPRDAFQFLIQQGDRGRKEATRLIAKEVRDFLDQLELSKEITEVLSGIRVELNASLRFHRDEDDRFTSQVSKVSVQSDFGRDFEDEDEGNPPKARGTSDLGRDPS